MKRIFPKRALFLCSLFNGLSQKIWVGFSPFFKQSSLMIGLNQTKIHQLNPDVILCPYYQEKIPEAIWRKYPCLIVHPGPPEDRGPSSLSWALLEKKDVWGVTVFQADGGWDSGLIWASSPLKLERASISYLYRNPVAESVLKILPLALSRFFDGEKPQPRPKSDYRPKITQKQLEFNWEDDPEMILAKINAGDSFPGTVGQINGSRYRLYGAATGNLKGRPGEVIRVTRQGISIGATEGSIEIARISELDGIKTRPSELMERTD